MTVTALLSVTGSALVFLGTVLGFMFARRKNSAEAASLEVKTWVDRIAGLRQELGAVDARLNATNNEVGRLRRRERLQQRVLHRHEMWDRQVVRAMRDAGLQITEPPALDIDEEPDPFGPRTRADD